MNRFTGESGIALPTVIIALLIALLLGAAVLQSSIVQTHQSGNEVAGEAAFNLAESAQEAQAFELQDVWPGTSATAYGTCNQSSAPSASCPGSALTSSFSVNYAGPSFSSPSWSVQVLDDTGGSSYYSESLTGSPVGWDANGDNRVWVRAEATVAGQRRIVVAQMVRQLEAISLPQNVITAGAVSTDNNGNKTIIEATDPNAKLTGEVAVRCADSGTPSSGDPCLGWVGGKGQLDPSNAYQAGYTDPNQPYSTLSAGALAQLKATAQADNTYYNGTCPSTLTGLVYVDNAACHYNGGTFNSDSAPGMVIFGSGTLEISGNATLYGIVYMADGQGTDSSNGFCTSSQENLVFTVHAGGAVHGAVFADRCGAVDAGDKSDDLVYDSAQFAAAKAYGTPALAKDTFKIVPNH